MQEPTATTERPRGVAPLAAIFFLSGTAGLIYEVVWVRMLIRTFGVTVYAVSTVLVVYMAGLALGSIFAGRRIGTRSGLLRLYAIAELAIGLSALLATGAMQHLPDVFGAATRTFGEGSPLLPFTRFVLAVAVLFLPTFLMGTTLPLVSGHLARRGAPGGVIGLLYGANTLGAVAGVLGSGFLLLMLLGEVRSVGVAVALNLGAGAIAWALSGSAAPAPPPAVASAERSPSQLAKQIYLLYGVSGFCALSYQVVWSRILNLLLGNSVYAFSLMLGVYLAGIGLGSLILARLVTRVRRPLFAFGVIQVLVALAALASLHLIITLGLADLDPRHTYSQLYSMEDFYRMGWQSVLVVLPVTLLLGALFPLAGEIATRGRGSAEVAVGELYGANTIGAIAGSFLTGFVMLDVFGTLNSFLVASTVSCLVGVAAFLLSGRWETLRQGRVLTLGALLVFVTGLSFSFRDPFYTVLRARVPEAHRTLAYEDDKNASVALFASARNQHLYINGLRVSDTAKNIADLMIDMPLSFQQEPRRVLVVGLGVGEAFRRSLDRGLEVTVVELVPSVVELFRRFSEDAPAYLDNPRARVVIDDGRNFLLGTDERFDLIFVDGTPPVFASGMVNLYSAEFLALVREHLTPTGVFTLWFPTICFERDFWMVERNFADTFPEISIFAGANVFGVLMLGSPREGAFDVPIATLDARLAERTGGSVVVHGAMIHGGRTLSEAALRRRAAELEPVTDDRPHTEFPLLEFWRGSRYYSTREFYELLARTSTTAR